MQCHRDEKGSPPSVKDLNKNKKFIDEELLVPIEYSSHGSQPGTYISIEWSYRGKTKNRKVVDSLGKGQK